MARATILPRSLLCAQELSDNPPTKCSNKEIRAIIDSIVREADLLYRYERAARIETGPALAHERIGPGLRAYIVYQHDDASGTVFIDSERRAVMSIRSKGPHCEIADVDTARRALSKPGSGLLDIKLRLQDKIT